MFRGLKLTENKLRNDPGMRSVFFDAKTDKVLEEGDVYKHPLLADTLDQIARKVKFKGSLLPFISYLIFI